MTTAIDPTSATTGFENTPATTSTTMSTDGLDREAFLKLLVAQLKYQDPTKPADTSQMLTQTAQLTMVDRLNEMAAAYQESAATQRLSLAGSLVGSNITFVDPEGLAVTARVDAASVTDGALVLSAGQYVVPYESVTGVIAPAPEVVAPTS